MCQDTHQNISSLYLITTMPVNSKIQDNTREGRIDCAIKALQRNEISSIRRAASIYRVNHETLRRRLQGHPARTETVANNRNLDDDEEQTLTKWILDLAARGYPPRKRMVEDTANLLRRLRGNPPVGVSIGSTTTLDATLKCKLRRARNTTTKEQNGRTLR